MAKHLTTQQAHPWRAVARTALAIVVGVAVAVPGVVEAITQHDPAQATGWLGGAVAVAGAVTRVMALPAVDRLLAYLGLGSAPAAELDAGKG